MLYSMILKTKLILYLHSCLCKDTPIPEYYIRILVNTVVWKIFIWNYFILENVPENNFVAYEYRQKYF